MSDDKSRRTEEATPKKIRDSRKKGQVARSKEVTSTIMLLAAALYFWLAWEWMLRHLMELITKPASLYEQDFSSAFSQLYEFVIQDTFAFVILPFVLLLFVFAALGNIVQIGLLFSVDSLIPRLDKINPISGFSRVFNMKSFGEALISLVKILVIGSIVYLVVRASLDDMIHDVTVCDVMCKREVLQSLVAKILLFVLPLFLILMVFDYLLQRSHFLKQQRMTKEEVKREHKDSEGDPMVKNARRQLAKELLGETLPEKVKRSRLVIYDGVIAIPLLYVVGETPVPMVLAIGRGLMAAQIVEAAAAEDVPVVRDAVLVQMLEDEGKVDQYIPDVAIKRCARVIQAVGG